MGMTQTSETMIKHHNYVGVSIPHKEFYYLCYNVLCITIEKEQTRLNNKISKKKSS